MTRIEITDGGKRGVVTPVHRSNGGHPWIPSETTLRPLWSGVVGSSTMSDIESANAGRAVVLLVVEDDADYREILCEMLEEAGYQVESAMHGVAALARLNDGTRPALILLDLMMPEMDGYETMKEIRKIPEFRTLPILALTAKAMKGDREKCLDAGASDYIAKPVNTDQLLSLMRVWLFR